MIDSSVLVAAFHSEHTHFPQSFSLLQRMQGDVATATLHSLAETYSGITRLPIHPRPAPADAVRYIGSLYERIRWIALDDACYRMALDMVLARRMPGAKIYDALIVAAAKQTGAAQIYTWNIKDFLPLAEGTGIAVRTPDA